MNCQDYNKELSDKDANFSTWKYKYPCCIDCSPMTGYNKPNTKEQEEFLDNNPLENIPF